jgi:zinc transport system ATP-binding protein
MRREHTVRRSREVSDGHAGGDGPAGDEVLADLRGVGFRYAGEPVLDDVSCRIGRGEMVALVGPNGSGKSTLLRVLVGLLAPAAGTVRLFGRDPARRAAPGRLGYVPQRPRLTELAATVDDVVSAGRLTRTGWVGRLRTGDRAAVDRALAAVDLTGLRHLRMGALSGGQQQRAFVARALAGEPELLVLDEPLVGVDAESQRPFCRALSGLVRERGGSVLVVSHELSPLAPELDRVIVLKNGVRFDGPPAALVCDHLSLDLHDLPVWLAGVDVGATAAVGAS